MHSNELKLYDEITLFDSVDVATKPVNESAVLDPLDPEIKLVDEDAVADEVELTTEAVDESEVLKQVDPKTS